MNCARSFATCWFQRAVSSFREWRVRFFSRNTIEEERTNDEPARIRMSKDKQLCDIKLAEVLEKRRLGQALNVKEFAVLVGVSYSVAREWVQLPGFPRFQGVVFWQDFVDWRNDQNGRKALLKNPPLQAASTAASETKRATTSSLPPRAAQILLESVK